MFKKDEFLKESKEVFLKIFEENKDDFDYTDVLGEVINFYFKNNDNDEILKEIEYDKEFLEYEYEFGEDFEDNYCSGDIIKSYKDALAYFSLNQLFNETYEEELEPLFPM